MLSRQRNSSIVLCTIRGSYLDSLRHELSSNGSNAEWSLHEFILQWSLHEFSYITCHPGITFSYKRLHCVCLGQTKFSYYTCTIMGDVYNICSWTQSADCMLRYIILTNGMMTINTFGIQCIQSINQISLFLLLLQEPHNSFPRHQADDNQSNCSMNSTNSDSGRGLSDDEARDGIGRGMLYHSRKGSQH